LHLAGCRFGGGVEALAAIIRTCDLRSLDISRAPCPKAAVAAVTCALAGATALQHLNLANMALGAFGAAALVPVIQTLGKLQSLILDDNLLEDSDAICLARAAAVLPELTHLSLQDNLLTEGVMWTLEMMEFAGRVRLHVWPETSEYGSAAGTFDGAADEDDDHSDYSGSNHEEVNHDGVDGGGADEHAHSYSEGSQERSDGRGDSLHGVAIPDSCDDNADEDDE
jgi:hypothetical protein